MVDLIYIAEFEEQKVVFQYFNDCCVNTEQFLRFASFHPTCLAPCGNAGQFSYLFANRFPNYKGSVETNYFLI